MIDNVTIVEMRPDIKLVDLIKYFPLDISRNMTNHAYTTPSFDNCFFYMAFEI